jgi:hypothetical protein
MFETFFGFKKQPFSQNPDAPTLVQNRNSDQMAYFGMAG